MEVVCFCIGIFGSAINPCYWFILKQHSCLLFVHACLLFVHAWQCFALNFEALRTSSVLFGYYSGPVWMHSGIKHHESLLSLSLSLSVCLRRCKLHRSPTTALPSSLSFPPHCSPSSCDPCHLCSLTAQPKDPMHRLPWQWPWRAPARHSPVHRNTRLHTAAKSRAIDILLYVGAEGERVGSRTAVSSLQRHQGN